MGRFGSPKLDAFDHHFSGFDEGGGCVALLQVHLADGVGGDDGGDLLVAEGNDHLGKETINLHVDDMTDELVAAGDAAIALAGLAGGAGGVHLEERFEGGLVDPVVAAGGQDRGQLAGEDPLFHGGVADAEHRSGFAGLQEGQRVGHG